MFCLSCESTADIPYNDLKKQGVPVLFYPYYVGETEYEDNMIRDAGETEKFYQMINSGVLPKTSQINTEKYKAFFEEILKCGDLIHIAFGSGMTGSVNNAIVAAEELKEKYPQRKIFVIDSLCSSAGYGMLVNLALEEKKKGKTIEEVNDFVLGIRKNIHHQFFSTDMNYYRKSGRVSGVAATVATVLNICPIMRLNKAGKIVAYSKIRGKKAAALKTVEEMKNHAAGGKNYSGKCYIVHSNCLENAKCLKEEIEKEFSGIKNIPIYDIGCVVASHCGPGTAAVFFVGDERPE